MPISYPPRAPSSGIPFFSLSDHLFALLSCLPCLPSSSSSSTHSSTLSSTDPYYARDALERLLSDDQDPAAWGSDAVSLRSQSGRGRTSRLGNPRKGLRGFVWSLFAGNGRRRLNPQPLPAEDEEWAYEEQADILGEEEIRWQRRLAESGDELVGPPAVKEGAGMVFDAIEDDWGDFNEGPSSSRPTVITKQPVEVALPAYEDHARYRSPSHPQPSSAFDPTSLPPQPTTLSTLSIQSDGHSDAGSKRTGSKLGETAKTTLLDEDPLASSKSDTRESTPVVPLLSQIRRLTSFPSPLYP